MDSLNRFVRVVLCVALATTPLASAQESPAGGASWTAGGFTASGAIETYSAYYAMRGTWWNLSADAFPQFDKDRSFGELWAHPKLDVTYDFGDAAEGYGAVSVGATQTLGPDAFDYADEGTVRLGYAMVGLRGSAGRWAYDASLGRQPFTVGTGMVLTAGASNGYSWGGGASAQRKAWSDTVIGKLSRGEFTLTGFVLEPDEAPEARTDTRIEGVALEWQRPQLGKAGIAWFTAPRSKAIYPGDLAPLGFIDGGRDGLDTWHGWFDLTGFVAAAPTLGLRAEGASQRNEITRADRRRDPMRAEAWLLGAHWQAQKWPFAPKFSYHVARFSGDDPKTHAYERFDPLFWGNGLDNWWFGANGAYSWLNANLRAQRFIVDGYVSAQDIVQLQYVRASVDRINSAVQFGQGARFTEGQLLVGVPKPELSGEVYLQYSRVFDPKLIVTAFISHSSPGDGLEAAASRPTEAWTTVGLGLTANF